MPKNNQNKDIPGALLEVGHIRSFFQGVASIQGLPHAVLHEVLLDEDKSEVGIVIGFDEERVEALFFEEDFNPDELVFRSFRIFSITTSDEYIGRIVDGLARPKDKLGKVQGGTSRIFRQAPPIIDREPVSTPISTGIKIIDSTLPLGRGQRELIIGDRKLGKSTLSLDIIINQKNAKPSVYCIYVLCGGKRQKLDEAVKLFKKNDSFLHTTIVAALAEDSFASQYLAPFVGCTIGEYFRDNGKDALIVYDDLSQHAKVYRSITLLLERAPGREAYPGDIFSLHASLLERAAKMSKEKGGGSLTALPLAETQEGDITSYIATNLISITDGQIYLEADLYQEGFLPAINIGFSVSRVGSQAQPIPLSQVTGGIRLAIAQYKELQKLVQLETTIGKDAQQRIYRSGLILELLKQGEHTNFPWEEQTILFYAIQAGLFDEIAKENWNNFETLLIEFFRSRRADIFKNIKNGKLDESIKGEIQNVVSDFKQEFLQQTQ